jgi:hypothetical protein
VAPTQHRLSTRNVRVAPILGGHRFWGGTDSGGTGTDSGGTDSGAPILGAPILAPTQQRLHRLSSADSPPPARSGWRIIARCPAFNGPGAGLAAPRTRNEPPDLHRPAGGGRPIQLQAQSRNSSEPPSERQNHTSAAITARRARGAVRLVDGRCRPGGRLQRASGLEVACLSSTLHTTGEAQRLEATYARPALVLDSSAASSRRPGPTGAIAPASGENMPTPGFDALKEWANNYLKSTEFSAR